MPAQNLRYLLNHENEQIRDPIIVRKKIAEGRITRSHCEYSNLKYISTTLVIK